MKMDITIDVRRTMEPVMTKPATRNFRRGSDRRIANRTVAEERRRGARRRPALDWIPLFRDADPRELDEALADCEVLLLPAGMPLLRLGEANRDVFILLSGRLVAQLGEDASPDSAIAISPGECIGELSAIDGKPISALVLAVSDARVLRMNPDLFWNRLMPLRGLASEPYVHADRAHARRKQEGSRLAARTA